MKFFYVTEVSPRQLLLPPEQTKPLILIKLVSFVFRLMMSWHFLQIMFSNNTSKQNAKAHYNNRGYHAGNRRQDYRPPLQQQQQHYQQHQQQPSTSWGRIGDEYAAYDYPQPQRTPYRQQKGQFTGMYGQGRDWQMHYREPEVNYNRGSRPRIYPDRIPSHSDRSDERESRSHKEHRHLPKDVLPPNRNSIDPKVYNCPGCNSPYYFAGNH